MRDILSLSRGKFWGVDHERVAAEAALAPLQGTLALILVCGPLQDKLGVPNGRSENQPTPRISSHQLQQGWQQRL